MKPLACAVSIATVLSLLLALVPTNIRGSSLDDTAIQYNALYATADDDLWLIDEVTGSAYYIGWIGFRGTDIAYNGKDLYGISFSGLYSIDPTTGASSLIGNIGHSDVNALTISADGTAYAATQSGKILKINIATGASTLVGHMGSGYSSDGDIAISDDNMVYASVKRHNSYNSWLVSINLKNGAATPIGDMGYADVWGLSFKDRSLFGVTSLGKIIKIDINNANSRLIGTSAADFWGLATSGKALTGSIVSPKDFSTIAPSSLYVEANAEYPGGPGVDQVEFFVSADGQWRSINAARTAPYVVGWTVPTTIRSQQLLFRIDVLGKDMMRTNYAGGVRHVNLIQSLGDPDLHENWIPERAYISQRALTPNGDSKCSASSMAMVLAMEGIIDSDYSSMARKANEMYPRVLIEGIAYVGKMRDELVRQGANAAYLGPIGSISAWTYLKAYIDSGHAVIVRSTHGVVTPAGHFVVAVGYVEAPGLRDFIAYDPFGQWRGLTCAELGTAHCSDNYYVNAAGDPLSHVGQWVQYDFDLFFGEYLIVPVSPLALQVQEAHALTEPDVASTELRVIGTNAGIPVIETVYLPHVTIRDQIVTDPSTLRLEAESATIVSPFQIGTSGQASGGHYVYTATGHDGSATFTANVPATGDYYLWARAKGDGYTGNSFWVSVDGEERIHFEIPQVAGAWDWGWKLVKPEGAETGRRTLAHGSHEIVFAGREPYAYLDCILLTNDVSLVLSD